ncbi:winged helix-turn-helix domain-containing protein [Streptomyces sp. ID03-2B]|uniref:ArsR/SmtB family transcription factor n=1 Tax=Streptomyces caviscabies TaxID=90079 RepID=A0ABW2MJQ7_9ACTN|nr:MULTISPECIES: winged helix-turn-helix domain-containing protein [unclassified Streptomyces]MDX3503432.1 winged helix-turn-helix domain-containing protein [Streptomyces sp. ATCC51928]MDX3593432.1 winged helix-turn-helix domain-containing protein [Streptomyces sp. ID03-2B]MDX5523791.1 winged helix-turn-helix domain-containing protein [Streptomyces sp. DE06-01C]
MLRIHFTPADLTRVRLATRPDPLWETVFSLHRLQTSQGRWAYADWYRATQDTLASTPLGKAVRRLLVPVVPRAAYFPDFLTPYEAAEGLDEGLAAVLDTPSSRVAAEVRRLQETTGGPPWAGSLVESRAREELGKALRAYHDAVIAPFQDDVFTRIAAERAACARVTVDTGVDGLLGGLAPGIRWRPPVLEIDYVVDRDLHLDGRGLRLIPSYFCWRKPVVLADSTLRAVLVYPLCDTWAPAPERPSEVSLGALLGKTRAAALRTLAHGATTTELAQRLGVSPATATHHTTVLRNAGLITTRRSRNTVLHTLTPVGAALLRTGTSRSAA